MKKILLGVLFLIISFLLYKLYILNKYHVEKINLDTTGIFSDTVTIKYEKTKDKTFKYEELIIKDDFTNLQKKDNFYIKYNKNNEMEKAISIYKSEQYNKLLYDGSIIIENDNDYFTIENRDDFLNDNNILNDIDLFNYIKKNYYFESDIFTSKKKVKENYILNNFIKNENYLTSTTSKFNSITLIDGDIRGYILNITDTIKEIHILHNNDQYIISLMGNDFVKDDYVISLLKTIRFD